MSNQANYASTVRNSVAQISTANTNRDGTGTLVPVLVAGVNGSRVDRVQFQAIGTTTAGMLRLFKTKGNIGTPIATMTSSTTTVTVTTTAPHGRVNGEKLYMLECYPPEYNVIGATLTVTGANSYTYQATTAPVTSTASTIGQYMTTPAVPVSALWREIPVTAQTPTGVIPAWSDFAAAETDLGYLPLQLSYGWLLQVSTNNAEGFNVDCSYGNY